MDRVRKYRPGNVLTVEQAIGHIRDGRELYFDGGHYGHLWLERWTVRDLINQCQANLIREAIITDEWLAKGRQQNGQ